ncbi:hypothetical protein IEQ34_016224 [Dendrobium chrysotoxum]|uniref:Uncharacterized protein n=1 Tax=Dendrobium chrysotoxum TaxID=161865 RepID=A0AAV7GDJ7_DENCH|nr:hypothetical protein IEQ34_016224 [Dendrobium chrysotoxum]
MLHRGMLPPYGETILCTEWCSLVGTTCRGSETRKASINRPIQHNIKLEDIGAYSYTWILFCLVFIKETK